MNPFEKLGLSQTALAAVERMGYEQPTPVQEQAIPLVLEGRDVVAAAQTGTGKTVAFALPAMDKLAHAKGGAGPTMLVITPTRELAQQIGEVAEQIALSTHHRVTTVVGGLSYRPQIEKLQRGTDVLIATPGRLIDLMDQKAVKLADVAVLVLDEADRMLDMGFLPSVKKIVPATPTTRQTLLFSATIDASILDVAGSMMRNPATVEIAHKGAAAETVDQYVIHTIQGAKPAVLMALLQEKGWQKVIVFARTRRRADTLCKKLKRAGFSAEPIHSDRSQNQRRRALDRFAAGETNIVVATDVLARGIDIDRVDYVVNYDVPEQPEDYIHRIGRTGRAGEVGFSVTFVTPETQAGLRAIEKLLKARIPELELEHFDKEQAEADAVGKAQAAETRRDPEIAKVRKELTSKAHKKEAQRAQVAAQDEKSKARLTKKQKRVAVVPGQVSVSAGSKHKRKRTAPAADKGGAAADLQRKQKAVKAHEAKPKASHRTAGKAANAAERRMGTSRQTADFRPGRAHRAEVNRQRQTRTH